MKHRMLAGLATAGLSAVLILGHATNITAMVELTNTVIGIGGQGNPTSDRLPAKLSNTLVPTGYDYFPVQYPASIQLDASRDVAVPIVNTYLTTTGKSEASLIIAGYSLGTLVAEQEKRNLLKLPFTAAPSTKQLSFVEVASPFAANGGIFNRFPGIGIPGITAGMGPAQPSRYDTTYSALMYDPYADFPAYFNPIALLNSVLSIRYGHPDAFYDPIDPATSPRYVTTKVNSAGGTDTYNLYYNQTLPLFGPLRELSSLTQTTAITEPLISAVEPLFRVLIDTSYTDRVNANPTASVHFSLITPPKKIVEALAAIPGALTQGVENLVSGGHPPVTLPNPIGNLHEGPAIQAVAQPVQSAQARLALISAAQPDVVKQKPVTPAVVANDPTSDGNKFTPGTDGAVAHSVTAGEGAAVTTIATIPTTSTPTTASPTTPVTAADPPSDKAKTVDSDTATAAAA